MLMVVDQTNRAAYIRLLDEMHRHRKAVFVDRLGWNLPVSGDHEFDAYDGAGALYLLSMDGERLLSSARLLPTTEPHLMSEYFPHLCPGGVPRGPSVWEASRFCVDPELGRRTVRRRELGRIIAGILEVGLDAGIAQVSFVASSALLPLALNAGWAARAIGPTLHDGQDAVTAVIADVTAEGFAAVCTRYGLARTVSALAPAEAVA